MTISREAARDSETPVALHEAAHAVVSIALGFRRVARVTMRLGTATWIGETALDPISHVEDHEPDDMAVASAMAAEAGAQFDVAIRRDWNVFFRRQTRVDEGIVYWSTVRFHRENRQCFDDRVLHLVVPATEKLVRLHEPAIRALAAALVESPPIDDLDLHGLDGDRVRAIVEPFLTEESKRASREIASGLLAELNAIRDRKGD